MSEIKLPPKYLEINESFGEWPNTYGGIYIVDVSKLAAWVPENEFEFSYVKHIVEAGLDGHTHIYTGRKYSFTDCTDWYKDILVDAIPPETTYGEVHKISVN